MPRMSRHQPGRARLMGFASAYTEAGLAKSHSRRLPFFGALYFSVVTFTTLGYGDIAPTNNPVGQAIVVLEVVAGVLGIGYFTALLIRRLL